jgi:superfamily II DNA or RNA helicase
MVDVTDIIRMVGGAAFQRGQGYANGGAVDSLRWDDDAATLSARVSGSGPAPYRTELRLSRKGDGRYRLRDTHCSCPVDSGCKHVAAAALKSNAENLISRQELKQAAPAPAGWQQELTGLLGEGGGPAGRTGAGKDGHDGAAGTSSKTVPLALQFELRTPEVAVRRWGPERGTSRQRTVNARLGVRPAVRNGKGNWVKHNLSWGNISYQTHGLRLDPDQHRWFSQFPALHRGTGINYFGNNDSWLYLDDFSNPLLWHLLKEAQRLGITFVGTKKNVEVQLGRLAVLKLDATAAEDSTIKLCPVLEIDGEAHATDVAGVIGDHGIYVSDTTAGTSLITIAPTDRRLTDHSRQLLQQTRPVIIPEAEKSLFLDEFYPRLRQSIEVTSSDSSVDFPEIPPPTLVLSARFGPGHTLDLGWEFEYRRGAGVHRLPVQDGPDSVDDDGGLRDATAEGQLLDQVLSVPGLESAASRTLQGMAAAGFCEDVLPALRELDGVRVDTAGIQPDYRELTETPELVVSTVETDNRDWFDLGVQVTVEGRKIPFDHLFRALAHGRTKLLLVDGTYLSLEQPVFDQLRTLIDEARELQEWDTGLRISRYQAGLWAEFEDLAVETEQARAWRAAVGGLLELESIAPVPLPAGLNASLRPYQQEGYNWLAFLWQHGLGGVLADDMGLGKTLQALALLAHVKERSPKGNSDRPFLVVAPTSVVHNWLTEARRFTPGLAVAGVVDTQAKSGVPLAAHLAGADVVVTSYTLFRLDFQAYQAQEWAGLVLDEAQFVKNRTARIHQCARDLRAPLKLAITGTPMENNLMELWSLFSIVAPGLFPTARKFMDEYQRPIERSGDTLRLERLRRRIRPLMMRRTKEAVASDLPAKQEQVLEVELHPRHRKIYQTYLQRERQKLLGLIEDLNRNRMIVFRSLTLLRMLSLDASLVDPEHAGVPSAKLDALFEQLEDVLAEGHRALVFSQFTSYLAKAAEKLKAQGIEYCYLDGSTRNRGEVISRFKDGKAPVFLISLKAGGFGLNLTEADYCFLLDPWWNPATEAQAVDRTHRIGQTRKVMVYRMVAAGTIEEKVMKLKEQKAKLFSSVMDDDAVFSSALTAEDIRSLLES